MANSKTIVSPSVRGVPGKVRYADETKELFPIWGDWPGGYRPRVLSIWHESIPKEARKVRRHIDECSL